jgi:hypothetical protein
MLQTKLGKWNPAKPYHHKWRWNYAPDKLYNQSPDSVLIQCHQFQSTIRQQFRFHLEGQVTLEIPRDHFPVEPIHNTHHTTVPFNQIFPFPQEPPNYLPETERQMIQLLPPNLKSLVENVERLTTDPVIMSCF